MALARIVSKTGSTAVGDALIAPRTSPVARSRSRASVSSRLRAASSVNRRTFSRAITAWSANVDRSWIWLSLNAWTSRRQVTMTPIGVPSLSIGTKSAVRPPRSSTAWTRRGSRSP